MPVTQYTEAVPVILTDGVDLDTPISAGGVGGATDASLQDILASIGDPATDTSTLHTVIGALLRLAEQLPVALTGDGRLKIEQMDLDAAIDAINVGRIGGTAVDMNSGNKSAGTQRVVLATDQPTLTNPQPVTLNTSGTATLANVASSATSVTLQASNASRLGWAVFNDSTAVLYVKCGTTASATSYTVQVAPGGYYELPFRHTGRIDGIWASANGNARVTEFT